MSLYTKPVVTIDSGMAEGVYAASGATQGTLNVTYVMVWDRWSSGGGKVLAQAEWSGIDGTITLNVYCNDTLDQADADNSSVKCSCSGSTATFVFPSTVTNPLNLGLHINHGTSIDNLKITGFDYSVN